MKPVDLVIGEHLTRVAKRWLYLRAALWSAVVLGGFALTLFGLGYAVWTGWIVTESTATTFWWVTILVWLISTVVFWIRASVGGMDQRWSAAVSEAHEPQLRDRLNTITHLEAQPPKSPGRVFLARIRSQAVLVLQKSRALPFSSKRVVGAWAVALVLLTGSVWFHLQYKPWKKFQRLPLSELKTAPDTSFELAPETERKPVKRVSSGEVRITSPGHDLKLTKVDVLEMKIEAASNETIKEVGWQHSVNGRESAAHVLNSPKEANYAAYTESLYLDELKLSDWDVVSYFAESAMDNLGQVRSELYFIEIRPFRSEISKMPGGENGKANEMLRNISGLITRQQQILRETQRFIGRSEKTVKNEKAANEDREKLEAAEQEIKQSADSVYAGVAAKMEHQPVAAVLDGLAAGADSMQRAANALHENVPVAAQEKELLALQQLVATRKMLQKAISDSPEAFSEEKEKAEQEPMEALAEVSELRGRRNSGKEELKRLEADQKELRKQSRLEESASRGDSDPRLKELKKTVQGLPKEHPDVAEFERLTQQKKTEWSEKRKSLEQKQVELGERLGGIMEKWPELFHGVGEEVNATQNAIREAGAGFQKNEKIQYLQNRVVDRMQDLQKAINGHDPARKLEEAERLDALIAAEARELESGAKGEKSGAQIAKNAAAAMESTRELRELAEKGNTGLGQELANQLTGEKRDALEGALAKLAKEPQAGQEQEMKKAAQGLRDISKAFAEARPKAAAKGNASDRNQPEDALSRAMTEMKSLLQRAQDGRPAESGAEAEHRAEILENLKAGFSKYATSTGKFDVLEDAQRALERKDKPLDVDALNRLMDSVEQFRVELSEKRQRDELKEEMNHSDPEKISPLYRKRVQEYFRHLSEK